MYVLSRDLIFPPSIILCTHTYQSTHTWTYLHSKIKLLSLPQGVLQLWKVPPQRNAKVSFPVVQARGLAEVLPEGL